MSAMNNQGVAGVVREAMLGKKKPNDMDADNRGGKSDADNKMPRVGRMGMKKK